MVRFPASHFLVPADGYAPAQIPRLDAKNEPQQETDAAMATFLAFTKTTLGDAVADVRISDRLTDSAVCLVAAEHGPDRQLERLLAGAGRIASAAKPILEVNPRHQNRRRGDPEAQRAGPAYAG